MTDTDVDISDLPVPPAASADVDISDLPVPPHAKKVEAKKEDSTLKQTLMAPVGAAEEFLKAGTSAISQIPAGLVYGGSAALKAAGLDTNPAADAASASAALTYQPQSNSGQAADQQLADTYRPVGQAVAQAGDKVASKIGEVAGPTAEAYAREAPAAANAALGVMPLVGAAANLAGAARATARSPTRPTPAPEPATPDAPLSGADLRAQTDPLAPVAEPPAPATPAETPPAASAAPAPATRVPGKPHIKLKVPATVGANAEPAVTPVENPTSAAPVAGTPEPTVPRFTAPSAEGGNAGAVSAADQAGRRTTLGKLNDLSGGQLGEVRNSAITGDVSETGTDHAHSKVQDAGGERMRGVMADETNALRGAADNMVERTGTISDGVDEPALRQRGGIISNAISKIEGWFDNSIKSVYATAKERARGIPITDMTSFKALVGDQSQFLGTTEGEALHRGVVARAKSLGLMGEDGAFKPATIEQAEQMRQYLGQQWTPWTGAIIGQVKDALDQDVAKHGGSDLFQQARALRSQKGKMLEDPTGIAKLLHPDDRLGINRDVPLEQVPDYVANLPTDQFNHVINVLKSSAHLGKGELADEAAAAIREIKGHMAAKLHNAGSSKIQGAWSAKDFYKQLNAYSNKMPSVFTPKEMGDWKTLNDASNILRMDRTYKGATVEAHNVGFLGRAREKAGALTHGAVDMAAHHIIPVVGPAIAETTGISEKLGKMVGGNPAAIIAGKRAAEVEGRISKLNGPVAPEQTPRAKFAADRKAKIAAAKLGKK